MVTLSLYFRMTAQNNSTNLLTYLSTEEYKQEINEWREPWLGI